MPYSSLLLNHFYDSHHAGEMDGENVYCSEIGNEKQGSIMRLYVRCNEQKIIQATFQAYGSPIIIGVCEYVCRWLEGKTLMEVKQLTAEYIMQSLGMSSFHNHVVELVMRVVQRFMN